MWHLMIAAAPGVSPPQKKIPHQRLKSPEEKNTHQALVSVETGFPQCHCAITIFFIEHSLHFWIGNQSGGRDKITNFGLAKDMFIEKKAVHFHAKVNCKSLLNSLKLTAGPFGVGFDEIFLLGFQGLLLRV